MSHHIVAFLQNMWVRDPAAVHRGIAKYGERYWRKVMIYALFAGCLTGRRLKTALGDEMCKRIHWEEVSREISDKPSFVPTPDPEHIRNVLFNENPTIVLCFGKIAAEAVTNEITRGTVIVAPHPAARQPDTEARLRHCSNELNATLQQEPAF